MLAAASATAAHAGRLRTVAPPRPAVRPRVSISHHAPKNSAATTSRNAPTQYDDSDAVAKLCAVPLVPHSTAAASTSATPRM